MPQLSAPLPRASLALVFSLLGAACTGEKVIVPNADTAPAVAIQSPPSGMEENEGTSIVFSALVKDSEDAEPDLQLLWTSDIDGVLSETSRADADGYVTFTTAALEAGNHVITLSATDSDGLEGSDYVDLSILGVPDAPTITVARPIAGQTGKEGTDFEFVALVEDATDDPETLTVRFESDLEGVFCEPPADAVGKASCTTSLSAGDHILTYTVTDPSGLSDSDTVYFVVVPLSEQDVDEDGWTEEMGDCDDANDSVHPGATEYANGEDDDCDGEIDEDTDAYDDDGDCFCESPTACSGSVNEDCVDVYTDDCDDDDDDVSPDATEVCDGVDNDCDDLVDEGTSCLDDDGDGYTELAGDCDDTSSATYPGATEVPDGEDNDCDGYKDEGTTAYDDDGDCFCEDATCTGSSSRACGTVEGGDCDDDDEDVNPDAVEICDDIDNDCDDTADEADASDARIWYVDADSDTYGSTASEKVACDAPSGYVSNASDCDDSRSSVYPGATETCNERDDDCDDTIDEGVTTTWYADADADGYGNAASTAAACTLPSGYVSNDDDCDDTRSSVFPGGTESCNGLDDDCDGTTDESTASDASTWYLDSDGDGYGLSASSTKSCSKPTGYSATGGDCNDASTSVSPGATEYCNYIDDDCDGSTDESSAADASTWYVDADGDGYGVSTTTKTACTKPSGYSSVATDCNDGSSAVSPAATETCNSIDDDCDSSIDEGVTTTYYRDADSDGYGSASVTTSSCSLPSGYVTNNTDCNDSDATLTPATVWYLDSDSDGYGSASYTKTQCEKPSGYVSNATDCNDGSNKAYPGATESCDSLDNDCDGTTDESGASGCTTYYYDYDGDGYGSKTASGTCLCAKSGYYTAATNTDCYDYNSNASPAATAYYTTNRGDGTYDYNCDSTESKYYTDTYSCSSWPLCDLSRAGWRSSVASCGASGSWVSSCSTDWTSCDKSTTTVTQSCK